jgi:hypothetical protein
MSNYKKVGFLFPLFVFAIGLYYIHESWHLYTNTEYLKTNAIETEGIVTAEPSSEKGFTKISYKVDGKEFALRAFIGKVTRGEKLPVYYDPLNPENSLSSLQYYNIRNYIGLLVGGFIASLAGFVGMYRIFVKRP